MRTLLLLTLLIVTGCQSMPDTIDPPRRQFTDASMQGYALKEFDVDDPAEGTNKQLYKFNAEADEYLLLPIVDAYKYVTPEFLRNRVHDFFLNVGEFGNFTNAVFQLKPGKAGTTLGRFVVNTTVGLLGTFDVATEWGIDSQPEDFGKTLAYYGAGAGPYIVLPFFGPSNLRDATGLAVDIATFTFAVPEHIEDTIPFDIVSYGVQPLDERASNDFRYFETGSPFEYELVRYISATARQLQVEGNNK